MPKFWFLDSIVVEGETLLKMMMILYMLQQDRQSLNQITLILGVNLPNFMKCEIPSRSCFSFQIMDIALLLLAENFYGFYYLGFLNKFQT